MMTRTCWLLLLLLPVVFFTGASAPVQQFLEVWVRNPPVDVEQPKYQYWMLSYWMGQELPKIDEDDADRSFALHMKPYLEGGMGLIEIQQKNGKDENLKTIATMIHQHQEQDAALIRYWLTDYDAHKASSDNIKK